MARSVPFPPGRLDRAYPRPARARTGGSRVRDRAIPILLVKGILTAHILYEDVAARPILEHPPPRLPPPLPRGRADSRGSTAGIPKPPAPCSGERCSRSTAREVDIECTLGPPGLCAISVDDLMRRAERRVEPFGFAHLQPELHDHALVLVLNAFKDGLRVMPWALEDSAPDRPAWGLQRRNARRTRTRGRRRVRAVARLRLARRDARCSRMAHESANASARARRAPASHARTATSVGTAGHRSPASSSRPVETTPACAAPRASPSPGGRLRRRCSWPCATCGTSSRAIRCTWRCRRTPRFDSNRRI